jgi:hypothetical protein
MELKAEKTVHSSLASGCYCFEDFMPFNPAIVADLNFGRVHNRKSGALTKTTV